jgi:tetratricopeptide (TPR) repeat protein
MTDGLNIRLELLQPDDLLMALAYSWLSMAIASQGRYDEALVLQFKAGKIFEGPAGEIPGRKLVWGNNTSRNSYCLGRYEEADKLLSESLADAERMESWYLQV